MKKRNPNWTGEELKLALNLYLSVDLKWLGTMTDKTKEIVELSDKLNKMTLIKMEERGLNFRSPSSVRMKLTNFKSLDDRYGKSALSNTSAADKAIWNEYHNQEKELYEECKLIEAKYLKEKAGSVLENETVEMFYDFCNDIIRRSEEIREKILTCENSDEAELIRVSCRKIINSAELFTEEYAKKIEERQWKEHGGINKKPIQRRTKGKGKKNSSEEPELKIGAFVKANFSRLVESGNISEEVIQDCLDAKWSRDVLNLGHAFLKEISEDVSLKEQMRDDNGYIRYWKQKYVINGKEYIVCKEWYESNRKYFNNWLTTFSNGKLTEDAMHIREIASYIKEKDLAGINIDRTDVIEKFESINYINVFLDNLERLEVIAEFQGSHQQFVVEDYDKLYQIMDNPKAFSYLTKENKK